MESRRLGAGLLTAFSRPSSVTHPAPVVQRFSPTVSRRAAERLASERTLWAVSRRFQQPQPAPASHRGRSAADCSGLGAACRVRRAGDGYRRNRSFMMSSPEFRKSPTGGPVKGASAPDSAGCTHLNRTRTGRIAQPVSAVPNSVSELTRAATGTIPTVPAPRSAGASRSNGIGKPSAWAATEHAFKGTGDRNEQEHTPIHPTTRTSGTRAHEGGRRAAGAHTGHTSAVASTEAKRRK